MIDKTCYYCKDSIGGREHYLIRTATKPKGCPNRWVITGYCCLSCEESEHKLTYYKDGCR